MFLEIGFMRKLKLLLKSGSVKQFGGINNLTHFLNSNVLLASHIRKTFLYGQVCPLHLSPFIKVGKLPILRGEKWRCNVLICSCMVQNAYLILLLFIWLQRHILNYYDELLQLFCQVFVPTM